MGSLQHRMPLEVGYMKICQEISTFHCVPIQEFSDYLSQTYIFMIL